MKALEHWLREHFHLVYAVVLFAGLIFYCAASLFSSDRSYELISRFIQTEKELFGTGAALLGAAATIFAGWLAFRATSVNTLSLVNIENKKRNESIAQDIRTHIRKIRGIQSRIWLSLSNYFFSKKYERSAVNEVSDEISLALKDIPGWNSTAPLEIESEAERAYEILSTALMALENLVGQLKSIRQLHSQGLEAEELLAYGDEYVEGLLMSVDFKLCFLQKNHAIFRDSEKLLRNACFLDDIDVQGVAARYDVSAEKLLKTIKDGNRFRGSFLSEIKNYDLRAKRAIRLATS